MVESRQLNSSSLVLTAAIVVISLTAIFVTLIGRGYQQIAIDTEVDRAKAIADQYKALRLYYTDKVVDKVKSYSDLEVSYDHLVREKTIPLPATMIHDLADIFQKEQSDLQVQLYSKWPFPNRELRELDQFSKEAIKYLEQFPDQTYSQVGSIGDKNFVRVAISDKLASSSCVACHNSHPETPKSDWKLNDVRGVLEVRFPFDTSVLSFKSSLSAQSLPALATICAVFLLIVWLMFKRISKLREPEASLSSSREEIAKELKSSFSLKKMLGVGFGLATLVLLTLAGLTMWETGKQEKKILDLTSVRIPTSLASGRLLNGVNKSLAHLRSYLILSDNTFLHARRLAWEQEIHPALKELNRLWKLRKIQHGEKSLGRVEELVSSLQDAQQEIETIAYTEENLPGMKLMQRKVKPLVDAMYSSITKLIDVEGQIEPSSRRRSLLWALADIRGSLGASISKLDDFLHSGKEKAKHAYERHWRKNEERFATVNSSLPLLTRKQKEAYQDFQDARIAFVPLAKEVIAMRKSEQWNRAHFLLKNEAVLTANKISSLLGNLTAQEERLMLRDARQVNSIAADLSRFQWILLSIGLLVSIVLGVFITRTVTTRLHEETEKVRQSSFDIRSSSAQQLSDVRDQSIATTELSSIVRVLSRAAKDITQLSDNVAELTSAVEDNCKDGLTEVTRAQKVVGLIGEQVGSIVALVNMLEQQSQEVDLAAEVIRELAEQTTILSYNASIEAAATGEAGVGFSVVADQVGKLAMSAKSATREVQRIISQVQQSVSTTLKATEAVEREAKAGLEVQDRVSKSITRVVEATRDASRAVETIQQASTEQSNSTERVKSEIDGILKSVRKTQERSEQLLATAEQLANSAEVLENI